MQKYQLLSNFFIGYNICKKKYKERTQYVFKTPLRGQNFKDLKNYIENILQWLSAI